MLHQQSEQRSWWKLVLTGFLAIAFGIGAVVLPAGIMFGRILDVIFGVARPLSASMTAVAAVLALVALVAVGSLVNLFGTGTTNQNGARARGVLAIAVATAAVFCRELDRTWAALIGLLELVLARHSAKRRTLLMIAAMASIAIGLGMMMWVFAGAVLARGVVGIAARSTWSKRT